MNLTGDWVEDTSHEHNGIHGIEVAQIVDCGVGSGGCSDTCRRRSPICTRRSRCVPD